ncbi:MAG TPA: hypothetical protein VFW22_16340 [Pseudolabrys sp.]|nr:hypothetical protein [Pseudolabrys sp.]
MSEDILAEGRALSEHYTTWAGKKNAYVCDGNRAGVPGCGSYIVTIDVAAGVTPFIVQCGNCGRDAHSKMYRVKDWLTPTHQWYRPDTLDGIDAAYHEHLRSGGLILRPIGEDRWLPQMALVSDKPQ